MNNEILQGKIALVTGANKGIGHEVAKQLAQHGATVFVGSRNTERGESAVQKLQNEGLNARLVQLDVTNPAQIETAASIVEEEFGKLDILVNNAGIFLDKMPPSLSDLTCLRQTYETNVFGVFSVTKIMLPLLRKAESSRIVNVTSELGSLSNNCDPNFISSWAKFLAYNSSKSALNAITVQFAYELKDTSIKVNAVSPGYTATDFNNFTGTKTVEQGAAPIVKYAMIPDDGPTGGFFDESGVVPW